MSDRVIPSELEGFNVGMNDVDNIKRLSAGVVNYLHNAYPDRSLKPINGIKDIDSGSTVMYSGNDAAPFIFTPVSQHIYIDSVDFLFVVGRRYSGGVTGDIYLLVWDVGAAAIHQWFRYSFYDQYSESDAPYYSLTKRYNSIYLTLSYAVDYDYAQTDEANYACKNKIFNWNTTTSLWEQRAMGIDSAPKIGVHEPQDLTTSIYEITSFYSTTVHDGELYKSGGYGGGWTYDAISDQTIYATRDGVNWYYNSYLPSADVVGGNLFSFNGELHFLYGRNGAFDYTVNIDKLSSKGIWISSGTPPWSDREGCGVVVFNNKVWFLGGRYIVDTTPANDTYYNTVYSWDGTTFTLENSTMIAGIVGLAYFGVTVYDDKIWIACGVYDIAGVQQLTNRIYNSEDGITWALIDTPSFNSKERHDPGFLGYDGKLWLFGGQDWSLDTWDGVPNNDVYYSTDGEVWSTATGAASSEINNIDFPKLEYFNNKMFVVNAETVMYTTDGTTWTKSIDGLDSADYHSYAITYVRRTDKYSILQDDLAVTGKPANYSMTRWITLNGLTAVSPDEKLLSGTLAVVGNDVTGTDTLFSTELAVNDYIRLNGAFVIYKVTAITNNTTATIYNPDSYNYTDVEGSRVPLVGESITTNIYHPGDLEGVEDTNNRVVVKGANSTDNQKIILGFAKRTENSFAASGYLNRGVEQGATHIRLYRTLGHTDPETVKGLKHHFLVDINITGDDIKTNELIYVDRTTDEYLTGVTNYLEMTGFSDPPFAKFSIWANDMLWLSGINTYDYIDREYELSEEPFNELDGYVYHSVNPKGSIVSFSAQHPQKFGSMFDLSNDYKSFNPNNGERDSGLAELDGDLYLFKEQSVHVIYNSDPINNPVMLNSHIGCVCPNTIVNADVPALGGKVVFFYSGEGWAYIQPGGKISLFVEFKISYLQRNGGILKRNKTGSTEQSTDWYSRNKVSAAFWDNTLWMYFGDYIDGGSQINEQAAGNGSLKCVGFYFAPDGESSGPFIRDFTTISAKYEPQVLVPVDNNRAYTFSHRDEYKLTRWNDPTQYIDTLIESDTPTNYNNTIKIITRAYESDYSRMVEWLLDKIYIYMDFDDTDTLTVKVYTNVNGQVATCTFSQERESGMLSYSDFKYRDFIVIKSGKDLRHAFYHHLEMTKQIPTDGDLELHGVKFKIHDDQERNSDEHMDQFGAASNVTFVVEADTSPEVNAHA